MTMGGPYVPGAKVCVPEGALKAPGNGLNVPDSGPRVD